MSRHALPRSWIATGLVMLCVASEYKFHTRAVDQTVNGKADPFVILELGVYALVAALLFWAMWRTPTLRFVEPVSASRWLYAGVLALSVVYATYRSLAVARGFELLVSAAFAQAVQRYGSSRQLRLMANAFVGLVVLSVLFAVLHRFPQPREQQHRFTWLYVHPINAANFCSLAAILCAALWLRSRRLGRLRGSGYAGWAGFGYAVGFLVLIAALLGTRTRMAVAATALALLVYALLSTRLHRKRVDIAIAVGLIAFTALVVAGPQLYAYLSRGEGTSQLATLNRRTELWSEAFKQIARAPLLGHGIGSSHGLFLSTTGLGGAHNAAIGLLTDAGMLGLLVWLVFVAIVLRAELRLLAVARGPMEAPLLIALTVFFLANSVTTDGLGSAANVQQLLFFVMSAWVVILARESRGSDKRAALRHVLALQPSADRYGADKTFVESVVAMTRDELAVTVMVAEPGPLEDSLSALGIESFRLPAPVLRKRLLRPWPLARLVVGFPSTLIRLVYTFRKLDPDLVYVNTLTLPHCVLAARLAGIPVVCHVRELESSVPRVVSRALTLPLLAATALIANSRATALHLQRDWRRLARRTTVIYNGIARRDAPRSRSGAVRTVGLVGRLSPRKGQDVAVEAVSALLDEGLDLELVLVGDCFHGYEWYEAQLRTAAARHSDRIRFAGYQTDTWKVYDELDLVLVPSRLEPFGLVALEAALAGKPIVATRVGGLPEIVQDGVTGILVDPGNPVALASAIESLIASPERAHALGREAAASAAIRFSPRRAEVQLVETLRARWGGRF